MDEQKKKSLSEISHLFLSSVRENATAASGGGRPRRIPPGGERVAPRPGVPPLSRTAMSIDLTPEEYARVIEQADSAEQSAASDQPPIGPITALICSQFNSQQLERAKEYARHLSGSGERIGLLHVDSSDCTVYCFETARDRTLTSGEAIDTINPRQLSEALDELAWDIDRWVLLLTNPRLPEARALLRKVPHWVLLSTCDHDGVVSCYRAIKGLSELPRPRLTLALMNAADQVEAGKVYRKIAGVCEQFLSWNMEADAAVEVMDNVDETTALTFSPPRDRAEHAMGPQWEIVNAFLEKALADSTPVMKISPEMDECETTPGSQPEVDEQPQEETLAPASIASPSLTKTMPVTEAQEPVEMNRAMKTAFTSDTTNMPVAGDDCDVSELPTGEVTEHAVLAAVMAKPQSGLVECPIRPPSCPQATLAVGRDRRLVLLAVARKGLGELRSIAIAYRWVIENRPLLSMALPQFSIDAHAMPSLKLLVDRADAGADLLLPMNDNGNVTVQTYRKLRWAGKIGLLLEAA